MGDQPEIMDGVIAEDSPMLRGALSLVEAWGVRIALAWWLVDGRCACGNPECPNPAKHPIGAGWQDNATSDPVELRVRLTLAPRANIGIATGMASGVVVLDVDGLEGVATLRRYAPEPIVAPEVVTSRGRHLYFAAGDVPLRNRAGARGRGFGSGLDLRAEGGFVIVPPSVHASGRVYAWRAGRGIEVALPPPTEWILEHAADRALPPRASSTLPLSAVNGTRSERWARAALDREIGNVRNAPEGSRNRTLNDAGFNLGMLVAGGSLDGAEVKRALLTAAVENGLSEFEATKTIKSGFAAGFKKDQRSGPTRDLPMSRAANGGSGGGGEAWEPPGPSEGDSAEPTVEPQPKSDMEPRYHTADLFSPLEDQRWCVPGLQIGPGRPTLFVGFGASAKTIAVQSLALCLASGFAVWGHFESAPMSVLHVDYEQGLYATKKRYQRLAIGHGIDPRMLENRIDYIEMPRVYLDSKNAESEYRRACAGFDLVVIDALRGAAPSTDENDSAFRATIDVLTRVSKAEGCSQLVLHHASKPRKDNAGAVGGDQRTLARGTGAIYDAAGCVLNFVAQPDGSKRIQQVKIPAEAEGSELETFELVVVDVAVDGQPKAGVRVEWRKPAPVDEVARAAELFERDARSLLKVVRGLGGGGGGTTNEIVARCGMRKARALDVLRALADGGRLELIAGPKRTKIYRVPPGFGGVP